MCFDHHQAYLLNHIEFSPRYILLLLKLNYYESMLFHLNRIYVTLNELSKVLRAFINK